MKCESHIVSKLISFNLLEDIYFKTIIPHVTFSISVWGSCSVNILQSFGGYIFQDYNSACNFLYISVGKLFSSYFCRN